MKIIIYVFSFTALLLFSCSSGSDVDDKTNSVDNSLLLKKWFLVSFTSYGVTQYHDACTNGNKYYKIFSEPNIVEDFIYDPFNDCKYVLNRTGTWSKDGNVILIDYGLLRLPSETLVIDELSEATFSYTWKETYYPTQESKYFIYTSNLN